MLKKWVGCKFAAFICGYHVVFHRLADVRLKLHNIRVIYYLYLLVKEQDLWCHVFESSKAHC